MQESLTKTLDILAPQIQTENFLVKKLVVDARVPVQVIIIMTSGVLSNKRSLDAITNAVEACTHSEIICTYKEAGPEKWNWDLVAQLKMEQTDMLPKVQGALWGHEAYKYRIPQPSHRFYEHKAMVANMIARMPVIGS